MTAKESLDTLQKQYKEFGKDLPRFEKTMRGHIRRGREAGDPFLVGLAYYYLALANYRNGGNRDAVLSCSIRAAALLDATDEYEEIAKCQNLLGIAYLGQENYQLALECFNRSHQTVRRHRLRRLKKDIILNNIANCYYEMGDFKSSIHIFAGCLEDARRKTPDDHETLAVYSINLTDCYERVKDYEKAKEILNLVDEWVDELDTKMWICLYYARRASVLYELGEREEGSRCADKALSVIGEGCDTYELHREFEDMTHVLIKNGDYERAKKTAKILNDYAEKNGHTLDKLIACRVMADYSKSTGDLTRALEYSERLNELYKTRMQEVKAMQLTVHKKIKEAGSEIRKLNKRIKVSEEAASREPLTKLFNRAALHEIASEFIDAAAKKEETVGAIFLDIDFFKECNDTYGHARGDEIIREVAGACLQEETATVKFARYGGDEFFGITRALTDAEVAAIAGRICERIRRADIPNIKNPNGRRVTLSVGVVNVCAAKCGAGFADISAYADKALYHAKAQGRNAAFRYDCERAARDGESGAYVKIDF